MTRTRGRFIVIEGTDGSGTTTQCERLVSSLTSLGINAHATREPTVGPIGQLLRAALEKRLQRGDGRVVSFDWATFGLLFAADRLDHVHEEILPALERGDWVVSDRYDLSSLIYQSVTAPEPRLALSWVRQCNANALRPDLVLVLDVEPDVAEQRRLARGGSEELFDRRELQKRLAEAYCESDEYSQGDKLIHIDGNMPVQAVAAAILAEVKTRLVS